MPIIFAAGALHINLRKLRAERGDPGEIWMREAISTDACVLADVAGEAFLP
jgi:hypothetical protein